jgi:hypothetical protein
MIWEEKQGYCLRVRSEIPNPETFYRESQKKLEPLGTHLEEKKIKLSILFTKSEK